MAVTTPRATYRTLDEQAGRLSPAEERFERPADDRALPRIARARAHDRALPVSTPPNAIVYSSGMLPITRILRSGAVFDVVGAVLCVVGVAVMAKVVGLA